MPTNIYYVYAYLREDGTPYYIGKGKGNRYKKRHSIAIPPIDRIQFLQENMSEEDAYTLEIELIEKYGRKNDGSGILRNSTSGGDGGDTSKSEGFMNWFNSEDRKALDNRSSERMRTNNPMFSEEVKRKTHTPEIHKKISESNKGKQKSDQHRQKLRESSLSQREEISIRTKKSWEDNRESLKIILKNATSRIAQLSEDEFQKWLIKQNLYDKLGRPNGRVKGIIDKRGVTAEYYPERVKL